MIAWNSSCPSVMLLEVGGGGRRKETECWIVSAFSQIHSLFYLTKHITSKDIELNVYDQKYFKNTEIMNLLSKYLTIHFLLIL